MEDVKLIAEKVAKIRVDICHYFELLENLGQGQNMPPPQCSVVLVNVSGKNKCRCVTTIAAAWESSFV